MPHNKLPTLDRTAEEFSQHVLKHYSVIHKLAEYKVFREAVAYKLGVLLCLFTVDFGEVLIELVMIESVPHDDILFGGAPDSL